MTTVYSVKTNEKTRCLRRASSIARGTALVSSSRRPRWSRCRGSLSRRCINERSALVEHLRLPRKAPASTDANSWKNLGALLGPQGSVVIGGEDITKLVAYAKSLELDNTSDVTRQNVYLCLAPTLPTFHLRAESLSKLSCLAGLISVSATDEQRATNFNRVGFVLSAGETVEFEGRAYPKCSPAWATCGLPSVQCDAGAFGWWNVAAHIGNSLGRLTLLHGTAATHVERYIRYSAVRGEAPAHLGIAYAGSPPAPSSTYEEAHLPPEQHRQQGDVQGFATKVVFITSCREFLSELEGKVAAGEAVEDEQRGPSRDCGIDLLDEGLASEYLAVVCEAIEAPAAPAVIRGQFGASLRGIVQKYCHVAKYIFPLRVPHIME